MAKVVLAERDFASGISTRNLKLPRMEAVVTWENAEALKDYDGAKEKLILQKLIAEALSGLKDAHKEIKDAIEDFDAAYGKNPPQTQKEADERLRTFQSVCVKAASGQEAKVRKAVEDEWKMHQKRDAALSKLNLKFAVDITLNAISLAVAVTTAALSMGTLAVTLVGAAKTVVSSALLIKDFAGDRDAAAEDVVSIDVTLSKAYLGPDVKGKAFKTAKEIAVAAGMPFMDSVGKLDKKLEDFLGKSARVDKEAQKLYESANKLMAALKKVDADEVGADNAKKVDQMKDKTDKLLDKISELMKSVDGDNAFYKANRARCDLYEQMNGKALGAASRGVAALVVIAGIVSEAKSIADIALKLA
jgi:hypothetical protein